MTAKAAKALRHALLLRKVCDGCAPNLRIAERLAAMDVSVQSEKLFEELQFSSKIFSAVLFF